MNLSVIAGVLAAGLLLAPAAQAHDHAAGLLPLGDGKLADAPKVGYVMSCQTHFGGGGGAFRDGPWIRGDRWDPSAKPRVDGSVTWPSRIAITVEGDRRVIRANNLPNHPTGVYPIARNDDAFAYDRNPNRIRPQDILLTLPAVPRETTPGCVPMGMIGFALTGTAIFNAFDAMGRDAPAHEIQDACNGHPQRGGQYHYHDASPCLMDRAGAAGRHSDLVGYALDGFGIYGVKGDDGRTLHSAELDACHGHRHAVDWDGTRRVIYHYHLTPDYPYTIGCFRGAVANRGDRGRPRPDRESPMGGGPAMNDGPAQADMPPRRGPGRDLERAAAALGVSADALRRAIGPPPPDFDNAARVLNIDADTIRRAMQDARRARR